MTVLASDPGSTAEAAGESRLFATLKRAFGLSSFRPHQEEIIAHLLSGQDSFVLMPTGGGKSLCYQLPALMLEGTAIVVSPLVALMKDQVDALRVHGIRAAYYNSTLSSVEARRVLAAYHAGEWDLIYLSPEALISGGFKERLSQVKVSLLAIDEAHCVSQWGHDFRPEYAQLGFLRDILEGVPTIALTATADPQTREDIRRVLRLSEAREFVTGFDRPNIFYRVLDKRRPEAQLLDFVQKRPGQAGIIYALSRKRVETLTAKLLAGGVSAAAYHAGLPARQRQQAHEDFMRDEVQVVVATVAFGMGIDKADIRFVLHYDIPKSIEGYYQETGRAGRDGLPAEALLLLGYQDVVTARALVEQSRNEAQGRIEIFKLNAMVAFAESLSCRRQALLAYFGESTSQACGYCDLCHEPPERYDATVDAQKFLSCVYRLRGRFGMRYVVDVLRGMKQERILRLGHDRLSTYGVGAERSALEWMSVGRQLIHRGYVSQDLGNYAVIRLTARARPVLRGEESIELARPRIKELPTKKTPKLSPVARELCEEDRALFEELKGIRAGIARSSGLAPYVVFGDRTLRQMAEERPQDETALLALFGVGDRKLKRYGTIFLAAISRFETEASSFP